MFNSEFWDSRVEKYGHTGHAEPFLYCFDQQARLYAVDKVIQSLTCETGLALDFGCGSGDFIELLLDYFDEVRGLDISKQVLQKTKERFKSAPVQLSPALQETDSDKKFDCILSVTVLQTFSNTQLEETLTTLAKHLHENGRMICIEFFSTEEYNQNAREKRVTELEWKKLLEKNKLQIETNEGFYNPILFPSTSWNRYSKSVFTLFLRLFKRHTAVQHRLSQIAKQTIQRYKDVYPYRSSTFKVYVIKKQN